MPGRHFFQLPDPDGRHRDVFPLPRLRDEPLLEEKVRRAVARRMHRRAHVRNRANLAIDALNSLFFGGSPQRRALSADSVNDLRQAQQDATKHILQACRSLGAPPKTACGSGALKALRAASSTYMMSEACGLGGIS